MAAIEENFKEQLAKLLTPGNTDTTFECPIEYEFYSENPLDTVSGTVPIITTTGQTLSKNALGQYEDHPLSPGRKLTPDDKVTPNILLQQLFNCLLAKFKELPKELEPTFALLVKEAGAELKRLLTDSITKQRLQPEQGIVVFIGTDGQTFNESTVNNPQYKKEIERYLAPFGLTLATARQKGVVRNHALHDFVSKINSTLSEEASVTVEKADALFNQGNYKEALEMYTFLISQLYDQPSMGATPPNLLLATYLHQIGKCYVSQSNFRDAILSYEAALDSLAPELYGDIPCSNPDVAIRYLQICGSWEHALRTLGYKGDQKRFGEAQAICERALNTTNLLPQKLLDDNSAIHFELATLYEGQLWALKKFESTDEDVQTFLPDSKKSCLEQFDRFTCKATDDHYSDPYILLKRAQYYTYLASIDKAQESNYTNSSAALCRKILLGNRIQELPGHLQQKVRIQYGIAVVNNIKHQKIPLGMTFAEYCHENDPSLASFQEQAREAERTFISVLHQDPNQRTAILNQSMVLFWLGDFEKAVRLCSQRLRIAPDDVPIKLNLLNALLHLVMMPGIEPSKKRDLLKEAKVWLDSITPPKAGEEKQLYQFIAERYSQYCLSMERTSHASWNTPSAIAASLSTSMSRDVFQTQTGALSLRDKSLLIKGFGMITAEGFNMQFKGQYEIKLHQNSVIIRNVNNNTIVSRLTLKGDQLEEQSGFNFLNSEILPRLASYIVPHPR